ncbi:ribosomal-protein-alanine acetyltransferase [Niallia circulans]|nr:ribosomal-protein-alanine acetyltransferase [Niallia circulans]
MNSLKTNRLYLRELADKDAPELFTIWSTPAVTKFMNIIPLTDVTQAEDIIKMFAQLSKEKKGNRYSIFLAETGDLIGTCGFNQLDADNDRGEIGYELGEPYWGHGYMKEALMKLVEVGFASFALNRIEAKVEPENSASIGLLEKIGFQNEGLLRQYEKAKGRYIDLYLFSLLKEEWA